MSPARSGNDRDGLLPMQDDGVLQSVCAEALGALGVTEVDDRPSSIEFSVSVVGQHPLRGSRRFVLDFARLSDAGVAELRTEGVARDAVAELSKSQLDALLNLANWHLAHCKCMDDGRQIHLKYFMPLPRVDFLAHVGAMESLLMQAVVALDQACEEFDSLSQDCVRLARRRQRRHG